MHRPWPELRQPEYLFAARARSLMCRDLMVAAGEDLLPFAAHDPSKAGLQQADECGRETVIQSPREVRLLGLTRGFWMFSFGVALRADEWPPTAHGSCCAIRFARLELKVLGCRVGL